MAGGARPALAEVDVTRAHRSPLAAIGQAGTRTSARHDAADAGKTHAGVAGYGFDGITAIRGRREAQFVIVTAAGLQLATDRLVKGCMQRA